jgi:imidazolonepropionase-like amidohydrolase
MVACGMSPMRAIQAATLETSQLLKINDRLGTIEAKKTADIVAVKGNPLEDIRAMHDVVFVMKEGVVYTQP